MPVRDRVVELMLRHQGHRMSFNNVDLTATVDGEIMPRDDFDERVWLPAQKLYEAIIDRIDWNRVLLEASARHIALDHPDEDYYGMVCPECVCEALLATETHTSWERQPTIPRLNA
jgi:hypothetical protein